MTLCAVHMLQPFVLLCLCESGRKKIRILFSRDLSFVRMPKNSAHHQSILVISRPSCFRDCFHGLCKTVPHAVSHYVDIAYSFDCVLTFLIWPFQLSDGAQLRFHCSFCLMDSVAFDHPNQSYTFIWS